ncbi:glycosyltransferase family 25 protein [Tranquillimonas alkanivorans]|uniref:Glycosyl transferase, family 25 n=1 Tax=Tranquillimonas alkanivorans TaxID=441119 RepID=A0A1I5L6I7_9RHOB|nr:glycosyltransferase family 25 protein [Tranquillimonas alkanivorans]SFO92835.1 glycosyl transferase, family 25 [Tranquillimonas alkanivorans]
MSLTRDDIATWLINLRRAEERRAQMLPRLDALGLPYEIFEAVDGRAEADALAHTVDRAAFERNTGGALLPGKIGCYHSHLRVWQKLVDSGRPAALILEDDVVFHDDFLTALDTALAAADHWDAIRFNAIRAKLPVPQGTAGDYTINAYVGPFTGNGAYLIKREVAQRLLPGLLPMTRPLDHELNRFFVHDYRQRGLEPWPSHIDDAGESQITGRAFGDVRKFSTRERLPYYRLKAGNYARRLAYLARTGAWPGSKRPLPHAAR